MSKPTIIWEHNLPCKGVEMAKNRVRPFIIFYGHHIQSIDLETLCASCYLQGFTDHLQLYEPISVTERQQLTYEI